ncbi:conjugal transfer protein TraR [Methylohalobius crimeensis]|uniref:conjugal transfer protein TraR n=1 Tax=Methylohalobius crimeensis TaxID=244365 RepID=UPI00190F5FAF|nr:conjugal transfer protein TraR [Methylohalobius crimeensis]
MADNTSNWKTKERDASVQAARKAAAEIPPGEPGECETCGEWSGRLVNAMCAPCRDRYGDRRSRR